MRIISGSFKGKKILEPKDKKTRPLKDLTKESIFNILSHSNKFKIEQINTNKCYLGTSYTNEFIEEKLIKSNVSLKDYSFKKLNDEDLYAEVAERISNNQIIGWFKGRCEWGPRALGNRSILADPRNPNIKDILNTKVMDEGSYDIRWLENELLDSK